jgi:NAD(P)H-flavin reductase
VVDNPLVPLPYRVVERRREASDVVTLGLAPPAGSALAFRTGQFNLLTAFGVGQAAISISGSPDGEPLIEHTVRDVGAVSHALCAADVGTVVGVCGPFGRGWGAEEIARDSVSENVIVVAGGIGLAPLRGAVAHLVTARASGGRQRSPSPSARSGERPGRVTVLVGARTPDQIIFADDLERWRADGADVGVTVDMAGPGWGGRVGVVTTLLSSVDVDPARTTAFVCGPEVMIRFTARALLEKGLGPERLFVSLERNMQCGAGLCGHCQLGPLLLCRDGPVVAYTEVVSRLLCQRER